MNRDFKGVWIPREIWLRHDLSAIEKCLFAEIDSFCSNSLECKGGNAYFSEFLGCSEATISRAVRNLIQKRLISAVYKRGREGEARYLKSYPKSQGAASQIDEPALVNLHSRASQIDEHISTEELLNKDFSFSGPEPTCQDLLKVFGVGLGGEE